MMNKIFSIFHILFVIISILSNINSIIVIPFKISTISEIQINPDYNSSNFLQDYFFRDIYANIITGIPSKNILALLDMKSHIFQFENNFLKRKSIDEIIDPDKKLSKETYDTKKSLSFRNISNYHYSNRELKSASLCSETFLLYEDLDMEKTTPIKDLEFIIDDGLDNDKLHIRLGLNKPLTKEYQGPPHFIQSLLDVGAITDQTWTINFLSKTDGLFILGADPHTYQDAKKDKKYQRQYYFKTHSLSGIEYHDPLSIPAQKIYLKNQNGKEVVIEENKGCYFNYNYGFIIGTKEYREYILKNFFDELINLNICSYDLSHFTDENDLSYNYYVISCDKYKFKLNDYDKKYYDKFPSINFFVFDYNYNFELTKEDLFVEINNRLYFMVIFEKILFDHSDLSFWNLGLPFLQKYEFVLNYDKHHIGFYIPYEEEEEQPKEKKQEDNKEPKQENIAHEDASKKYIIIIIVCIIVAIILIIAAFLVGKNMYQSRKGRANELKDEDYDYISKDKNEKEIN